MIENYLLAQFSKSNPGKLKEAAFKKPLNVQYGSWAVQKGNGALRDLPEQVPLQGPEQRPDGLDLQEHRGHDDPADAQVLIAAL